MLSQIDLINLLETEFAREKAEKLILWITF